MTERDGVDEAREAANAFARLCVAYLARVADDERSDEHARACRSFASRAILADCGKWQALPRFSATVRCWGEMKSHTSRV
jgi:hypothetical protein